MSLQVRQEYLAFLTNHSVNPLPAGETEEGGFSRRFFANTAFAVSALERIINSIDVKPASAGLPNDVYAEFALTGHGETETNSQGKSTGHSGGMLNRKGFDFADEQRKEAGERPYILVSSDLPRAIHHALIKFATLSDDEQKTLDDIGERVNKREKADDADYAGLVKLALDHGIIPTPLARAQFYSILELEPEKFEFEDVAGKKHKDKDLGKFAAKYSELKEGKTLGRIKPAVRDFLEAFLSGSSDRDRLGKLYGLAMNRKDATEYRQREHLPEDENRLLFYHRVDALLSVFEKIKDGLKGRKIEIVAHSGFIDVALWYFRHNSHLEGFQLENREKGGLRGETVSVKVNERFEYLNDHLKLVPVRNASELVCSRQRAASLDEGIRNKGNSIIPVELLGFIKKDRGKYEPLAVALDDVLKSEEPTLILGNFGQGKSTAAVELAELLNSDQERDGRKYKDAWVAVFLTAKDITDGLKGKLGISGEENESTVLSLLSGGVNSLHKALRHDYKFVFVIDALDELVNGREHVLHVARDLLPAYGKVILTSRFSGFSDYENPGFRTLHIDPGAVFRNLDAFLASRVKPFAGRDVKQFKEFLSRQDESVKTSYLLVHFLADLYNSEKLGNLRQAVSEGEILIKGIELALWEHKLPKRTDLLERPVPCPSQSSEDARRRSDEYEAARAGSLKYWMGFLQRVAAYMAVHNVRSIDRKGLEEVYGGWTVSGHLSKKG
jgi:broad specificity phosphatase PhoE